MNTPDSVSNCDICVAVFTRFVIVCDMRSAGAAVGDAGCHGCNVTAVVRRVGAAGVACTGL